MYNKIKKILRFGAIIAIFLGFVIAGTTYFKANGQIGVFWTKEKGFEYAYNQDLWTSGEAEFQNIKSFDVDVKDVYVEFTPADIKNVKVDYTFIGTEKDITLEQRGTKLVVKEKREPKERFVIGPLGMTYQEVNRVHHNPYMTVDAGIFADAPTQNEKLTIHYPQKMKVNMMKLVVTGGDMNLDGMTLQQPSTIHTTNGNINLNDTIATKLELGIGNGSASLRASKVTDELIVSSDWMESNGSFYSNGSLSIEESKIEKLTTAEYVGSTSISGIETKSDLKFSLSDQLTLSNIKAESLTVEPTYYGEVSLNDVEIKEQISILNDEGNNSVYLTNVKAKNLNLTSGTMMMQIDNSDIKEEVAINQQNSSEIRMDGLKAGKVNVLNSGATDMTVLGSTIDTLSLTENTTVSVSQSTFKTVSGFVREFAADGMTVSKNTELEIDEAGEMRVENSELKDFSLKGYQATVNIHSSKINGSNLSITRGDMLLDGVDLLGENKVVTETADVMISLTELNKKDHAIELKTAGSISVFDEAIGEEESSHDTKTYNNKSKSENKIIINADTSDVTIR